MNKKLKAGDKLWNGATVTPQLAAAYNALQERIQSFGDNPPQHLLNAAHNLIASAK